MSWSVYAVGRPEQFKEFFDKESERLTGQSKEEFDVARPHIEALINLNVSCYYPLVSLSASGNATKRNGVLENSEVNVKIEKIQSRLIS